MKNLSNKEHVSYDECHKECIHNYGEHKDCLQCNYYIENEYEKEIADFEKQQNQALDRCLSRLEDGELL